MIMYLICSSAQKRVRTIFISKVKFYIFYGEYTFRIHTTKKVIMITTSSPELLGLSGELLCP